MPHQPAGVALMNANSKRDGHRRPTGRGVIYLSAKNLADGYVKRVVRCLGGQCSSFQ